MATDRLVFGMHHLNITQAGAGMVPGTNKSHISFELDLAGEDSGIDFFRNMMPNTYWKLVGKWGTSGTVFYWSSDKVGNPKKVMCADGNLRYITLAMTHSYANYTIGKIIGYKDVMYQEGTNGFATGNHIHLECCEGLVKEKVLSGNVYIMKNMLDPRKAFFILDGYTTVKSTLGLEFKHCSEAYVREGNDQSSPTSKGGLYYRVHVQRYGWLGAVHDGMVAGTTGQSLRVEALKITPPEGMKLKVEVHIQGIGWKTYEAEKNVSDPIMGTTGQGKRLEAIRITVLENKTGKTLKTQAHVQSEGWLAPVGSGEICGTTGKSKRMEALKMWLE